MPFLMSVYKLSAVRCGLSAFTTGVTRVHTPGIISQSTISIRYTVELNRIDRIYRIVLIELIELNGLDRGNNSR